MSWISIRAQKFLAWFRGYDGIPYDEVSVYDRCYTKVSVADGYNEGFRDGRLSGRREILNEINKRNKRLRTVAGKRQKRKPKR